MSSHSLQRLAVTMGDPAGIGPEVCLHLLANAEIAGQCVPVVIGDAAVLRRVAEAARLPLRAPVIDREQWAASWAAIDEPTILDLRATDAAGVVAGQVSATTGRAAFTYIERAIEAALARQVVAVSTAPINKEALHAAGIKYPGHTEIFADRTSAPRSCMMQYSEEITCTFVTVHVGYRDVPRLLTKERILDVIELTAEGLARLRGRKPQLVVCGLNPHAGEHGLFGDREEERIIVPAIETARARGIAIEGPLPPDTAFLPWKRKATDAFICMYHDQGHIPVKALAFDSAVNTTLGLPIVRTSVDHGTACDIAWQGKANPSSIFAAVRLALRLAG
ncbi:MAG TPA: 4-hydroxythreonine-4-phosphate dehydrogenase PdxA [Pirellulaceae bacterium]|nr:4-hydroxythreonine-4-phosphate dehydrogenase PdxA [Pirellulaceae bacterium]